jgi:hypothetical protein
MKKQVKLTFLTFLLFSGFAFAQSATVTFKGNPYKYKTLSYNYIKNVKHIPQTQMNWCWAATLATVLNSYVNYQLNDCQVANMFFNANTCSNPEPFNKQNSLYSFQKIVEPFKLTTIISGRISWNEIKNEIDNGNPIIIRVESNLGQGHFIVIIAYEEGYFSDTGRSRYSLTISDPMYGYFVGDTDLIGYGTTWEQMKNGWFYNYEANWTHTVRFSKS